MGSAPPLTTLLSWAWVALTIETDNAFEVATSDRVGRRVRISLPMWTNGLRHIDDDGTTVDQLGVLAGARCNIGGLERWGWISVGDSAAGRRPGYGTHRGVTGATVLRPTAAGRFARRVWPRAVEGVEARWRVRFGDVAVDGLRAALARSTIPARSAQSARAGALPWSPPEVNPTDGFRTQVVDAEPGSTTEEDRPLAGLLGQALTGLTLAYERAAAVSLPLAADLLRVVDGDTVRTRDLPALSGLGREAVAMAVASLCRDGLANTTPGPGVVLTPGGLDAGDEYRERSAQLVDTELRAALEELLANTPALAAGLAPPLGCWRGENPYLAQTRRLLGDPIGSLPWQPMVLHRAGWPDGS